MAAIEADDTLLGALRSQSTVEDDPAAAAQLASLRQQVNTLVSRLLSESRAVGDATPAGSAADEPTSEFATRPAAASGLAADELCESLAPAQSADEIGRLGSYRVLRVLGSGGMGVVFEAEDSQLKRRVALKAMRRNVAGSMALRKRFLREAQTAAAVEHDHIVPIYQVGDERGVPFIAMPLLRGETLAERLAKGHVATSEVIRIGREIALGLDAAHRAGLIHRDIKPGNIWLEGASGRVKILDFGLARLIGAEEQLTQSGALLGTPSYMAPEQGRGEEIDARADLFSLGCVLYHIATGVRPFIGRDPLSTLLAVTTQEPRPACELNPDLPVELSDLTMALLAKDPSGRPQTAAEVVARLGSIALPLTPGTPGEGGLQQDGATRTPDESEHAGIATIAPSLPPSVSPSPNPSLSPSPPSPPRRLGLVGLAAATAAAALVAGIVVTIKNEKDETIAQFESERPVVFDKLAPGHKLIVEQTADDKPEGEGQKAEAETSKTQDLSPKTSSSNPKSNPGAPRENPKFWHGWPTDAPAPAIAPFDATQARKHQQEWADYLKLPLEHTNSIGMKFVLIPPGEFTMGSPAAEIEAECKLSDPSASHWLECIRSEAPQHTVVLTRPFYLGVHEVTQTEYEAVMGQNPSLFAKTGSDERLARQVADVDTTNYPVENVSFNDAAEFCATLSKKEHLRPFYFRAGETVTGLRGTGYRLPTEAEWECACRAGTTTRFWCGDNNQELVAAGWFVANSGERTHKVEELPSNAFGLFDMHGNAWEWVGDSWQPSFYERFKEQSAVDPNCTLPAGSLRVLRGGFWGDDANHCLCSRRFASDPRRRTEVGFRVGLAVDALRGDALAAKPADVTPTQTPSSAAKQPPSTDDPNAEVFNWVNEVGGRQEFWVGGAPRTVFASEVKDALPDGPSGVWTSTYWIIKLPENVTRAELNRLRPATKPLVLNLEGTKVTDDALAALNGLSNLVKLDLRRTNVTRAGVANLGTLPGLGDILLAGTLLSGDDLSSLATFPNLERMTISARQMTPEGIEALSRHAHLIDLDVDLDERDQMANMGALRQLRRLGMGGPFNDACVECLKGLSMLERLELG